MAAARAGACESDPRRGPACRCVEADAEQVRVLGVDAFARLRSLVPGRVAERRSRWLPLPLLRCGVRHEKTRVCGVRVAGFIGAGRESGAGGIRTPVS